MRGSQPGRHRDAAETQTACGDGYVDGAGAAVSCVAATRASPRNAQPERRDRSKGNASRTHRGFHGAVRRVVDLYYRFSYPEQRLYGDQRGHAQGSVGSVSFYSSESDSIVARGDPGTGHHDEPEPAGPERSRAERTGLRRESARGGRNSGAGAEAEPTRRSGGRPRGSAAGEAERWTGRRVALLICKRERVCENEA